MKYKFKNILSVLVLLTTFLSCAEINETDENKTNNEDNTEWIGSMYKVINNNVNGFDRIIYKNDQCFFLKNNDKGLPISYYAFIQDNEGITHTEYVLFDDEGLPELMLYDDIALYFENYHDSYYDLMVVNSDGTSFIMNNIDSGIDIMDFWNEELSTKAEQRTSNPELAFAMMKHLIGGVTMVEGGCFMLIGCSMLIPGVNVAVGTSLMIAGAATFVAGALLTTRATDQIISDGTHTQGFDEVATVLSFVPKGTDFSVLKNLVEPAIINGGYAWAENEVKKYSKNYDENKERFKTYLKGALKTEGAEIISIEKDSRVVNLYGSITDIYTNDDNVGILISSDQDALYVEDFCNSDVRSGRFCSTFSGLPENEYYYRAYYVSSEYNRTFIAAPKKFTFPKIETGSYNKTDNGYEFSFNVYLDDSLMNAEAGICISKENSEPTLEDMSKSIKISNSGNYSISFRLQESSYFYRSYLTINNSIQYGETHEICIDIREVLEQFYKSTNGDNWNKNDNWCTDAPLEEWYGVIVSLGENQEQQIIINLENNNLVGDAFMAPNKLIKGIYVEGNSLSSINVSDNLQLRVLSVGFNKIKSLILSGCTFLEEIDCIRNILASIDVKVCPSLRVLRIGYNSLTSLNVQGHPSLEYLYCEENPLTSLNVSGCTSLKELQCLNTPLPSLDVSGCKELSLLYCENNQLTSINVLGCTSLECLYCKNNQLTSLNVSGCKALSLLDCENNQLTSLNVSECPALSHLEFYNNRNISSFDAHGCTSLKYLDVWGYSLTSLNVIGCSSLEKVWCPVNSLSSLNMSGCTSLMFLECASNQLTSIDVSECTSLEELSCWDNQLTALNVSSCTNLTSLDCKSNNLTTLNISGCTSLRYLNCGQNQLASLNISEYAPITHLLCKDNRINAIITPFYQNLIWFDYDVKYTDYKRDDSGKLTYTKRQYGWWYPGEPEKGYHGE